MAAVLCAPILIGMILLASCQNGIGLQTGDNRPAEGKGIAAITLVDLSRTAARTILPTEAPTFSKYVLSFTPGEGNTGSADDVTVTGAGLVDLVRGNAVQVELEPGAWTVTVKGYQSFTIDEADEEYLLAAEGSAPLAVTAGETNSVTVTINPLAIDAVGEKGVFSYEITLPDDLTEAQLLLTPVVPGASLTVDLLATGATGVTGIKALAAGEYGLLITLKKGGLSAGVFESVHIYPGLESRALINLVTGEDRIIFADVVFITGTVSVAVPDAIRNMWVRAYSESACTNLIAETTADARGGAWLLQVPVQYIGQAVYVKAEVEAHSGYEVSASNTVTVTELLDKGHTGITITIPVKVLVAAVSLNKWETTLYEVGTTETLIATITPENAMNPAVTWSTSDAAVATVNNGVVTAVGPGSATITVTSVDDDTKTASATVTVVASLSAASVFGLVAPVIYATPVRDALSVPEGANYRVGDITWKKAADDSSPYNGYFDSETAYYADIVLYAAQYYRFTGTITPTVNAGTPDEGSIFESSASWNTLTFRVSFPATQSNDTTISGLTVNGTVLNDGGTNFNITVDGNVTSVAITLTKHAGATAEYKLGSGDYGSSATLSGLVLGTNTVTVKITAEAGEAYVAEYTITVTRSAGTVMEVNITFWVNESDASILASSASAIISRAQAFTATVSSAYTATTVQWYVDGDLVDGGAATITINGSEYNLGIHRLDVTVIKDSAYYSKEITFRVIE
jgi:hypothetical protein